MEGTGSARIDEPRAQTAPEWLRPVREADEATKNAPGDGRDVILSLIPIGRAGRRRRGGTARTKGHRDLDPAHTLFGRGRWGD